MTMDTMSSDVDVVARALSRTIVVIPPIDDHEFADRWALFRAALVGADQTLAATLPPMLALALALLIDERNGLITIRAERWNEASYRAALDYSLRSRKHPGGPL